MNEIILMPEVAQALSGNVEALGAYLVQMGQMMNRMQKRLDEMEENQKKITLTHQEVKELQVLIRLRAMEYCEKYQITDPACLRKVSAAMKKAVLTRYGVKDLHDVPAIARSAVEAQICHFTDIRLVMKCREMIASGSG
jgi:Cu/Ag efflux protein CusF